MATSFRQLLGVKRSVASTTDSTLIIIDAQNEYATGKLQCSNVAESRKVIASLLEKYRAAGGDVVHVVHDTPENAPVFTPGTVLADEFEELKPQSDEKVIHKLHPSSFAGTDLHEYLGGANRKIVLVGYMAHVCISTTARNGAQLGYDVLVVEDAIGDRDIPGSPAQEVVRVVLNELSDAFATVIKSSDIV